MAAGIQPGFKAGRRRAEYEVATHEAGANTQSMTVIRVIRQMPSNEGTFSFPFVCLSMHNEILPPSPVALVVDDEPLIRMDTADIVADEGFEVVEARTADEAFKFLQQHHSLQLVITDIQTGGSMDGCQLAWEVKRRWPNICVVVASGAGRPADGDLPPSAIFLAKPISPDVVHEAIEEYCGQCDVR